MKYFFVAGEASGDLHASNLIKAIRIEDSDAKLVGYGGDLMEDEGMQLLNHYRDIAIMGFVNVLLNLRTITKAINRCKKAILSEKPDVVVLIDFPGFNLRIAEFAHKHGFKVIYYIAPKVWASRQGRVKQIRAYCDKVITIFPFETAFFKQHNVNIEYVGNPLLDAIDLEPITAAESKMFRDASNLDNRPIIALLAGSRRSEIHHNLPIMLSLIPDFPKYQFVIAGVTSVGNDVYRKYIDGVDVTLIYSNTYNLFKNAKAALVTSGTATLEAALLKTPQVVCYNFGGGFLFYRLMKMVIRVKYISLVNLIMDSMVVKELIKYDMTRERLTEELEALLEDADYRAGMISCYESLLKNLGGEGASTRAAHIVVGLATNGKS